MVFWLFTKTLISWIQNTGKISRILTSFTLKRISTSGRHPVCFIKKQQSVTDPLYWTWHIPCISPSPFITHWYYELLCEECFLFGLWKKIRFWNKEGQKDSNDIDFCSISWTCLWMTLWILHSVFSNRDCLTALKNANMTPVNLQSHSFYAFLCGETQIWRNSAGFVRCLILMAESKTVIFPKLAWNKTVVAVYWSEVFLGASSWYYGFCSWFVPGGAQDLDQSLPTFD